MRGGKRKGTYRALPPIVLSHNPPGVPAEIWGDPIKCCLMCKHSFSWHPPKPSPQVVWGAPLCPVGPVLCGEEDAAAPTGELAVNTARKDAAYDLMVLGGDEICWNGRHWKLCW